MGFYQLNLLVLRLLWLGEFFKIFFIVTSGGKNIFISENVLLNTRESDISLLVGKGWFVIGHWR